MNRDGLYEADDDDDVEDEEDDGIGEDLEDIRRACMVPESNSDENTARNGGLGECVGGEENQPGSVGVDEVDGGGIPSDSDNEDDMEMLRSIKERLALSTDVCDGSPMGLGIPLDSESEDDFEMLRSIKSRLALSMDEFRPSMGLSDEDEDDDDAFETLRAIRRRFSAYENFDPEGNFTDDSPGKKKQVLASDNETSSEILSRSNTCESFPDQGKRVASVPDSEEAQAGHSVDLHENTANVPFGQLETCQLSLVPAASSSFPESAQAFVEAIRRNRSYQRFLRRKMTEIEATIEQNEKHKKNVKILKEFQASCKKITRQALSQKKDPRLELISTQKSGPSDDSSEGNDKKISPLTFGPLENPRVANYRMALEKYPLSVDRRNWSTEENENLAKGLKQQVQEALLFEAMDQSSGIEGYTDDLDSVLEIIKNHEITPEMIRQFLPKVSWDQLALMYVKDRSAAECEARWMSCEDPLINHSPWTAEEDKKLLLVIHQQNFEDWLDIAVSLGTNRTPFQCLARYQRSLNAGFLRREWTAEEDDQLRAAVDLYGEKDWQSVANSLVGRAGTQCSNRWKKTLHPTRKKVGRWSSDEDKRMKVAVTLFGGKNWSKIAQFVPGRTPPQCRERWVNSLDPKVNRGPWTNEEDTMLREAISEHGYGSWSKVASHLPSRTDNQCWRRWKKLYPHQVPLLQEARKLRREIVVGNFVDRESERPALGINEFLALPAISLEPEPEILALTWQTNRPKKRKGKCEIEAEDSASGVPATKRQPKRRRRRKGTNVNRPEHEITCESDQNTVGDGEQRFIEWDYSIQDTSVAEPSESMVTTSSKVKIGAKKLIPRRKVSAVVHGEK